MKMLQVRFIDSILGKLNFKNSVKFLFILLFVSNSYSQVTNFVYTGANQTYTVPPCVTSITVTVAGAKGGGVNGGNGAQINATLAVTPGQVLTIVVGGLGSGINGGFGGGANGANANSTANASFGGGGASRILNGATSLIVAAGGGGTGGGTEDGIGGIGGCAAGGAGTSPFGQGGGGATQFAGGTAGPPWIATGSYGYAGTLGLGGVGASDPCNNNSPGGGGGGGLYGGGGGGSDCYLLAPYGGGGGGGGSSLVPAGATCSGGVNTGNGYITITPIGGTITPTFNPVAAICQGTPLSALPTTSLNGFTGTWSPALDNTQTTVYTFSPTAGQCASTANLTITVNLPVTTSFTQIAPICYGSGIITLPTTSDNSVVGTWSPSFNDTLTTLYTFTPNSAGCATSASMNIIVNPSITPSFDPVPNACAGSTLTALPLTSLNGINGTWSPALDNTVTTIYTFSPSSGQCVATADLTITITQPVTPTFTPVPAACAGSSISALPTLSNNGINGLWSPAIDNTTTTVYTFQPSVNECATSANLTINITSPTVPAFSQVNPVCTGGVVPALPLISTNGVTGTWSPAFNNTTTTLYTFTPTVGLCATTTTMTITILPNTIAPTFNPVAPICAGQTLNALPTTSTNMIIGAWSPAINNNATTTYTFTPNPGQCAVTGTLTITVNPLPTVNAGTYSAVCANDADLALSGTPAGGTFTGTGVSGTNFDPSVGTSQITYSFTNAGGCAGSDVVTIQVNPNPTINAGADQTVCAGTPVTLQGSGGVTYSWTNNVTNNQAFSAPIGTNSYTVTGTNANGCTNTDQVQLIVVAAPVAGISPSVTNGQSPLDVTFTNTSSNANNYIWNYGNGDGENTGSSNPTSTSYNLEGVYTVTLTASNGICSDVETVTITVQDKFPATVIVPNVFSPNGDGLNDHFYLKMENAIDVKVIFLNRWGEVVYELNGLTDFWNGKTRSGVDASEGVYFFKYEVTGSDNSIVEGHGNVTLIR